MVHLSSWFGYRYFLAELMAMTGNLIINFSSLSLSRYLGWFDLFGLSNWEESSNRVTYLSFNSLPDNYSCINGTLINLYFFLAASRVGKNCQTYKCREDRFFWINFNENTQGRVTSFSSFPNLNDFLHSLWLILAITITIGYRSNREADKRWSKIDGTWFWTNQVANSSGGKSLFLGILLYVMTLKLYSQGIILDSLFIFLSLNFLLHCNNCCCFSWLDDDNIGLMGWKCLLMPVLRLWCYMGYSHSFGSGGFFVLS